MCQVWCSSIQGIYARLLGASICHGYMCIVLYMKPIWCNGFAENYASFKEGDGVNLPWVDVYCAIYELMWCNNFQTSILDWRRESGVNLPLVYVHHAIYIC